MGSSVQDPSVPAASVEIPAELLRGQESAPPARELKKLESRKIGSGDAPETGLGGALAATLLVLGLLLGAFLLLRKLLGRTRLFASGTAMRVLARKPLAPRQEVVLVEIGARVFVVGATRESLTRLGEITGAEEIAALRSKCGAGSPEPARLSVSAPEPDEPAPKASEASPPGFALKVSEASPSGFAGVAEELTRLRSTVRDWSRQEASS